MRVDDIEGALSERDELSPAQRSGRVLWETRERAVPVGRGLPTVQLAGIARFPAARTNRGQSSSRRIRIEKKGSWAREQAEPCAARRLLPRKLPRPRAVHVTRDQYSMAVAGIS
jgi:hypothetical protein